jgi:hypothetical protein
LDTDSFGGHWIGKVTRAVGIKLAEIGAVVGVPQ